MSNITISSATSHMNTSFLPLNDTKIAQNPFYESIPSSASVLNDSYGLEKGGYLGATLATKLLNSRAYKEFRQKVSDFVADKSEPQTMSIKIVRSKYVPEEEARKEYVLHIEKVNGSVKYSVQEWKAQTDYESGAINNRIYGTPYPTAEFINEHSLKYENGKFSVEIPERK
jgi:hypothetical protein